MTKIIGGTKTVPLTAGLLLLIETVQSYAHTKRVEYQMKKAHDLPVEETWLKETEDYFNKETGPKILEKYALTTNQMSFEKVRSYVLTPKMKTTHFDELPNKFTF